MKIRNGFVSNSSSSSFIVLRKDTSLSDEELKQKTIDVIKSQYTRDDWDFDEDSQGWAEREAEKYAEANQYMIMKRRVDWGGEDAVNDIIPELLKSLGVDTSDVSYEWGE